MRELLPPRRNRAAARVVKPENERLRCQGTRPPHLAPAPAACLKTP